MLRHHVVGGRVTGLSSWDWLIVPSFVCTAQTTREGRRFQLNSCDGFSVPLSPRLNKPLAASSNLDGVELQERRRRRPGPDVRQEEQPELREDQHALHALAVVVGGDVVSADPQHHLRGGEAAEPRKRTSERRPVSGQRKENEGASKTRSQRVGKQKRPGVHAVLCRLTLFLRDHGDDGTMA